MKIYIEVKTGSKKEKVEKISSDKYKISVKEQPEKGKANKAVIKVLSNYFKVFQSQVDIRAGHTSKSKIIDIKK